MSDRRTNMETLDIPPIAFLGCQPGGSWKLVNGKWEPQDEATVEQYRSVERFFGVGT